MTPREKAEEEIKQLVIELYEKEFKWAAWLFKKFMRPDKILGYASRVMDISEKYVKAVVKENSSEL